MGVKTQLPTEVIERGEGLKPYRPRKAPAGMVLNCGPFDDYLVLVLRTHDVERADSLAMYLWYRDVGESVSFPEGKRVWVRFVPWDASGHGGDSSWIYSESTDRRAVPAVAFEL